MTLIKPVDIADAKARLRELVERAANGEEIVIGKNGEPRARLVPVWPSTSRVPGRGAGRWEVSGDFNEPLADDGPENREGGAAQRIVTIAEDASGAVVERKTTRDVGPHCSFCGKLESEVKWLHRGPAVFVCDECVSICADIQRESEA